MGRGSRCLGRGRSEPPRASHRERRIHRWRRLPVPQRLHPTGSTEMLTISYMKFLRNIEWAIGFTISTHCSDLSKPDVNIKILNDRIFPTVVDVRVWCSSCLCVARDGVSIFSRNIGNTTNMHIFVVYVTRYDICENIRYRYGLKSINTLAYTIEGLL